MKPLDKNASERVLKTTCRNYVMEKVIAATRGPMCESTEREITTRTMLNAIVCFIDQYLLVQNDLEIKPKVINKNLFELYSKKKAVEKEVMVLAMLEFCSQVKQLWISGLLQETSVQFLCEEFFYEDKLYWNE